MNRRLILLLILVLITSILSGCNKTPKPPEGVNQDFYDDMYDVLKKIEKQKGKYDTDNGKNTLEEYLESKVWLNSNEIEILEAVDSLYFWVWFYNDDPSEYKLEDKLRLQSMIEDVAILMDIKMDISKFKK